MAEQVSSLKTGIKYKNTPIGKIPVDWEIKRLVDMVRNEKYSFTGGPFGSDLKEDSYTESGVRVIQLQNIGDGKFLDDYKIFTSEEKADQLQNCNIYPGDIIIAKMADPVARACIIPDSDKRYLMASDGIRLSVNKNEYDVKFILYAINSPYFRKNAERQSTGTTRLRIGLTELKNLLMAIPPLKEQKKIAEILTTVDEAIEKTDQVIEESKEVKTGLMQKLLTRGIGHEKFKKTEIGEIPEEWEVVRLEDICDEIYRYPTYYNIEYVEQGSGVPEIRGELIKDNGELSSNLSEYRYISRETSSKFSRTILHEGDFVLSVRGTMGKIGYISSRLENANMTANLMRISTNREKVYPLWMKQFFISDFFQSRLDAASSATTIKTIKAPELKEIELVLPLFREQKQIAEILTSLDEEIEKETSHKEQLGLLKEGLMQVLLTGKIRVSV